MNTGYQSGEEMRNSCLFLPSCKRDEMSELPLTKAHTLFSRPSPPLPSLDFFEFWRLGGGGFFDGRWMGGWMG